MTTNHQSPPSVKVHLCRGRVVVLLCGLQVSIGCTGSGVSQVVQVRVSHYLYSTSGHPGNRPRNLQVAATCAGSRGSQIVIQSQLPLGPGLGLLSQRYGVGDRTISWVGRASSKHQGRTNSVIPVDSVSDGSHLQVLGLCGGGLRKGTVASACLSVWERAVPQLSS